MIGLPHISLMLATVRYLMSVHDVSVLASPTASQQLVLLSAQSERNGDTSYDLYVVKSYTARDLWQMKEAEWGDFMGQP